MVGHAVSCSSLPTGHAGGKERTDRTHNLTISLTHACQTSRPHGSCRWAVRQVFQKHRISLDSTRLSLPLSYPIQPFTAIHHGSSHTSIHLLSLAWLGLQNLPAKALVDLAHGSISSKWRTLQDIGMINWEILFLSYFLLVVGVGFLWRKRLGTDKGFLFCCVEEEEDRFTERRWYRDRDFEGKNLPCETKLSRVPDLERHVAHYRMRKVVKRVRTVAYSTVAGGGGCFLGCLLACFHANGCHSFVPWRSWPS